MSGIHKGRKAGKAPTTNMMEAYVNILASYWHIPSLR